MASDQIEALRTALDIASDLAAANLTHDSDALRGHPDKIKPAERDLADVEAGVRAFNALLSELSRLRAEVGRTERNRDMWKGQCERQAAQIAAMRGIIAEMLGLSDNWPGIAYSSDLEARARSAAQGESTHDK